MFDHARREPGIAVKLRSSRNSHFQMQVLVMIFGQEFEYSFSLMETIAQVDAQV